MPHIHEKVDFTAEVFIVHKNKVLLRIHDKYKIWLSVGGHIEVDEAPDEAAIREVKEEVGLEIKLVDGPKHWTEADDYKEISSARFLGIHNITPTHRHVVFVYFATADSDQVKLEKPGVEWKWVTKEELQTMDLRPNVRFYAGEALKELEI